jgi:hypothetical protein
MRLEPLAILLQNQVGVIHGVSLAPMADPEPVRLPKVKSLGSTEEWKE